MVGVVWIFIIGTCSQVYATKLMRLSYHDEDNSQYESPTDRSINFRTAYEQLAEDDASFYDTPLRKIPNIQIYSPSQHETQHQISDVRLKFRGETDFNPEGSYGRVQSRTKPTYSNSKPRNEYSTVHRQVPAKQTSPPTYYKPAFLKDFDDPAKTTSYRLEYTLPSHSKPASVPPYSNPASLLSYPSTTYTRPKPYAQNSYSKSRSHSKSHSTQSNSYGQRSQPKPNSYSSSSYQRPKQSNRGNSNSNAYPKSRYQQTYSKSNSRQPQTYPTSSSHHQQTYPKPSPRQPQPYTKPSSYQQQTYAKPSSHHRQSHPKPNSQQHRSYPKANSNRGKVYPKPAPEFTKSDPYPVDSSYSQSPGPSAYVYEFRSGGSDIKQQEYDYYDDDFDVSNIPGIAGTNYPTMSHIPSTGFDCNGLTAGFYADVETNCQVWHYCDLENRKESFLCNNGTIYNQESRVCDWWYNVDCSKSTEFYNVNDDLYKIPVRSYGYSAHKETANPENYYDY